MSQRFEGRNLEEALQNASQTLGVERWQLTYHVLMEKRGFLGGVKRIVIEADVNREAAAPAATPGTPIEAPERDGNRSPRGERSGRSRDRRGGGHRERSDGGRDTRGRRGRSGPRELRTGDFEAFMGEIPEQGPESEGARTAREWCEDTIVLAKLDLVVRTEETEENILVRLYGADASRLTEQHGELLDAIQVLANKALVGRKVEKEIELDCEQFKDRRVEELRQRAAEVAERVRQGGREELLPAMTPIERRIIHMALREDAVVTTESRGDGFYKRIAIVRRPAQSDPVSGEPSSPLES